MAYMQEEEDEEEEDGEKIFLARQQRQLNRKESLERLRAAESDNEAFFVGFCHAKFDQQRDTASLYLGHRHVKSPIRMAEFQFLVDIFRNLRDNVQSSSSWKRFSEGKISNSDGKATGEGEKGKGGGGGVPGLGKGPPPIKRGGAFAIYKSEDEEDFDDEE